MIFTLFIDLNGNSDVFSCFVFISRERLLIETFQTKYF